MSHIERTMVEKQGVVLQKVLRNIYGWEDLKVGENGPSIIGYGRIRINTRHCISGK